MADLARRKRLTVAALVEILGVMTGLTVFSVPLYNYFCRVTGYGGTTQTSAQAPEEVIDRTITVRFNADTGRDLPWNFQPAVRAVTVPIGETSLVVAVSSPHRKEAFQACQAAVDRIKEIVPIWKKEVFDDGSRWVACEDHEFSRSDQAPTLGGS